MPSDGPEAKADEAQADGKEHPVAEGTCCPGMGLRGAAAGVLRRLCCRPSLDHECRRKVRPGLEPLRQEKSEGGSGARL